MGGKEREVEFRIQRFSSAPKYPRVANFVAMRGKFTTKMIKVYCPRWKISLWMQFDNKGVETWVKNRKMLKIIKIIFSILLENFEFFLKKIFNYFFKWSQFF